MKISLEKILENKSNLYVLDLSWHMYRGLYAHAGLTIDIGGHNKPTGHIYGVYKAVRTISDNDPNAAIILAEDGRPVRRQEIMTASGQEYKAGRHHDYNIYQDVPLIKAMMSKVNNLYWAYNDDKESDDEMYAIAKKAEDITSFRGKVYLFTGDNDLYQSITSRTYILKSMTAKDKDIVDENRLMTDEKLLDKFKGVDPKHITNFRAIRGDSSDAIKGITRFPSKLAYQLAMSSDNITEGYKYIPITASEEKWMKVFEENKDLIKRNYQLMKLDSNYEVNLEKLDVNEEKVKEAINVYKMFDYSRWISEKNLMSNSHTRKLF